MQIVNLTRDRLEEVTHMFVEALGDADTKPVDDDLHAYFDDDRSWVGLDDGGRVLGFAGGFPTRITLPGGAVVAGGGVPWVGVRIDAQGTGVGHALMDHQLAGAAAAGDGFLALNSSQYPIYGRWGYGPTGAWWSTKLDPRRLEWLDTAPAPGRVRAGHGHELADAIRDAYARSFGRWSGEVERHDGYWPRRINKPPEDEKRRAWAVHHDHDGRPDAAVKYEVTQVFDDTGFANKLEVQDLFGVDDVAQARLVRWLCQIRLLGEVSVMRTDPGAAWPQMLVDPRQVVTTERNDTTWVRVLDVVRVLRERAVVADGSLVLRVRDGQVGANDTAFRLDGHDGRLTVEPTDGPPDLAVDVRHLGPLTWAHVTADTLAATGQLTRADGSSALGEDTTRLLTHLLSWPRPAWSSTMF